MQRLAHDVDADGTRIRLWERSPSDPDEAVLFVHGATYPGRVVFDLDASGGYSWLDATARAGRAAFAVDLRGYGDSERPPAMDAPADANPPPARADAVVADVRAALAAVRERVDRVHLVGYSWGTIICGRLLASSDAPVVASLTQFAPVFRMDEAVVADFDPGDPAPAYRRLTLLDLRETVDADPYDPAAVGVPTLVVRGSEDPTATRADAYRLYDALDAPREYAELGGGTHFLPLEARRGALYDAVAGFHDRA
ncbi:alpha/beta hydrolase [Halorarius halobius]|uniref:alpha/beta hydrolase n=1 Tax=Halorarius halobius TaxID=2962671 RepID=UPI0020CC5E7F|nr:alpha/beta fold hydrolase [Halorarius halobius]